MAATPQPPVERHPAVQPVPVYRERHLTDKSPVPPPSAAPPLHQPARAEPDRVPAAAVEYGETVNKAVRKIVREWKRFSRVNLQIYLSLMVKPEHLNRVAAAVEKELAGLHQGNLAAFGLSPAEFAAYTPPAGSEAVGE